MCYNVRVMGPDHVENIAELACRISLAYRGVSHITIPVDFQEMEVKAAGNRSHRNIPHHVSDIASHSARMARPEYIDAAAEILNSGKRVAILAGRGALNATDELEATAEKLGAPIIKALLGRACVPDDSPYTTGTIGLLGTKPSQEAMEDCDRILIVGSSFPYIEFMPKPDQARGVQIDIDPVRIGLRFPVEVGLVGDSRETLRQLIPKLEKRRKGFLEQARDGMKDWVKAMEKQETATTKPMKPQVVAAELRKRLPENAIVNCDSGTIATWWARHIPVKRGQLHTLSGNLATMACGLPYTIASQIAYPDRLCVGFVGDGGFTMLMGDFVTAVKYKLPIKIVIIKNNSLGQIGWEQMVFLGNPEYACELSPIDFAAFGHACGGAGFTIENPASCGQILDEALLIPAPLCSKLSWTRTKPRCRLLSLLVRRLISPNRWPREHRTAKKIVETMLADKIREMV